MSSIIRQGDTYHGIRVESRGVFTTAKHGGTTYAGQCKDGYACGLGVLTWSNGYKIHAEHGPDGKCDGRYLFRNADGDTYYSLRLALTSAARRRSPQTCSPTAPAKPCWYNDEVCAPDDPRLLALIAQVAPVEVRPAAPAG